MVLIDRHDLFIVHDSDITFRKMLHAINKFEMYVALYIIVPVLISSWIQIFVQYNNI